MIHQGSTWDDASQGGGRALARGKPHFRDLFACDVVRTLAGASCVHQGALTRGQTGRCSRRASAWRGGPRGAAWQARGARLHEGCPSGGSTRRGGGRERSVGGLPGPPANAGRHRRGVATKQQRAPPSPRHACSAPHLRVVPVWMFLAEAGTGEELQFRWGRGRATSVLLGGPGAHATAPCGSCAR